MTQEINQTPQLIEELKKQLYEKVSELCEETEKKIRKIQAG